MGAMVSGPGPAGAACYLGASLVRLEFHSETGMVAHNLSHLLDQFCRCASPEFGAVPSDAVAEGQVRPPRSPISSARPDDLGRVCKRLRSTSAGRGGHLLHRHVPHEGGPPAHLHHRQAWIAVDRRRQRGRKLGVSSARWPKAPIPWPTRSPAARRSRSPSYAGNTSPMLKLVAY